MKKSLACVLALVFLLALLPPVAAVQTRDLSFETKLAEQLATLGLFRGVGEAGGSANFDLARTPTRTEALVMLLRAMGCESEALATAKTHPFKDVPKWADAYVSYAYAQGISKGVGATRFGAQESVTANMYLSFLLRALGYVEGSDLGYEASADFTWSKPEALAAYCGILPLCVDSKQFLRADAVSITAAALAAKQKGTDTTLQAKLITKGVFTTAQLAAAFPADPFAKDRAMDRAVTQAIGGIAPLGAYQENFYGTESHRILDCVERDGALELSVLVCYVAGSLGTGTHYGGSSSIALWQVRLDAKSLALLSCKTAADFRGEVLELAAVFSEEARAIRQAANEDIYRVCGIQRELALQRGEIAYKMLTYESELLRVQAEIKKEVSRLETAYCTAILGVTEKGEQLFLIYPAAKDRPEAETVRIPGMAGGSITLSADGEELLYVYAFAADAPPKSIYVASRGNYPDGEIGLPTIKTQGLPKTNRVVHQISLKNVYERLQLLAENSLLTGEGDAYEKAIQEQLEGTVYLLRVLELPQATLLLARVSTPRGSMNTLSLLYKEGSKRGAGVRVSLPLQRSEQPEELSLSADGRTLTYTTTIATDYTGYDGQILIHAGRYVCHVDLEIGTVTESFIPK